MSQSEWNTGSTALIAAGVAVSLSVLFRAILKKDDDDNKGTTPWPKVEGALPIIGNAHQLGDPLDLKNRLHEWALKYSKETGVFEANIVGQRVVVICREDLATQILLKRPEKVIRSLKFEDVSKSLGANGVFTSVGKRWKMERRLIAPAFNHINIKDYMKSIKLMVRRLVDKWGHLGANGNPVVVNDDATWFTVDIISLTALGRDFDALRTPNPESEGILRMFRLASTRFLSPIPYWHIPIIGNYLDGIGFRVDRVVGRMKQLIDDYRSGWVDSSETKDQGEGYDGDTLLKKVVSQSLKDKTFDRAQLIGNLVTIFLAGIDSSASILLASIHMLATDETGLQEELTKEVDALPPLDELTLDGISGLPRLRSFLYEVLRFHAAAPLLGFNLTEDIPFCGTTLTKDMDVFVLSQFIMKNPYSPPSKIPLGPNGEKVTEFCARRFLTKDGSVELPVKNSTSFLTFGHGVRRCLGQQFFEVEALLVLSELVRTFKMALAPGHEPIGRVLGMSEMPDRDVRVVFTSRAS